MAIAKDAAYFAELADEIRRHGFFIVHSISQQMAAASEAEGFFRQEHKTLRDYLAQTLSTLPEAERDAFLKRFGEDANLYSAHLPDLHRQTAVVTMAGLVERQMQSYCTLLEKREFSRIKPWEMPGSGFEQSLLYLREAAGVDVGPAAAQLAFLRGVLHLRGVILDRFAMIAPDDEATLAFIRTQEGLNGGKYARLAINPPFIAAMFATVQDFFVWLNDTLAARVAASAMAPKKVSEIDWGDDDAE